MKNRCTILSIPVFLHRVTAWKRVMPDKILRDGNLRSLWSKQTKHEENDETCAIFIAITPPWFRAVNIARQGWRRWKFHGATPNARARLFPRESKQNCMVGATLCTHAAQSRHVEITLHHRFFFIAFPVDRQRATPFHRIFLENCVHPLRITKHTFLYFL